MKHPAANYGVIALALALLIVLQVGCRQKNEDSTSVWSKPVEVAKSSDSLSTSFSLYKWNGSLLALGGDSGTYAARVLEGDGENWKTISTVDPGWIPMDADARDNRFLIARASIRKHNVDATISVGSLRPDGRFLTASKYQLALSQLQLFPNAPSNFEIHPHDQPGQQSFAGGVIDGAEIRLPYRIDGTPIERRGRQIVMRADLALTANGVFSSSDGGKTWRDLPILESGSSDPPSLCRTKGYYFFFAVIGPGGHPYELKSSRCPRDSDSWSAAETLSETGAKNGMELRAVGEDDVAHICWLDSRNESGKYNLLSPRPGNYEVAYCRRKDSDTRWGKDVILSKGLRWAYSPSMSVEGNNVVVAWAGAKSDKAGRTEWTASDIYYVISKDSGMSWTKPSQVTDGFRSGITSGRPQVALHKGVIHLFYVQGKADFKSSGGLVRLNLPPWPILYQQRPFPTTNP